MHDQAATTRQSRKPRDDLKGLIQQTRRFRSPRIHHVPSAESVHGIHLLKVHQLIFSAYGISYQRLRYRVDFIIGGQFPAMFFLNHSKSKSVSNLLDGSLLVPGIWGLGSRGQRDDPFQRIVNGILNKRSFETDPPSIG